MSAIFADRLWIFWNGKMAVNSGKLYSVSFCSVSQMLKIRKCAQRWRTTGILSRLVKWGFQAMKSKIRESSLFYYNSNRYRLIRVDVIEDENASLRWVLIFIWMLGRRRKQRLSQGSERISSSLQSLTVWVEEVNWIQSKGAYPKNNLCDQFLHWEDFQWSTWVCLEVASITRWTENFAGKTSQSEDLLSLLKETRA